MGEICFRRAGRGGRRITPSSGGSAASASPGSPSVIKLIQRIWIGSKGMGRPEEWRQKDGQDLGRVAGEDIADELADVVEDAPSFGDGRDDGGEVVVEEDQACGFARHVGAVFAHGDTDIGLGKRRRIVYAVSGHGNKLPAGLKGGDDPDFLRGVDAGKDAA